MLTDYYSKLFLSTKDSNALYNLFLSILFNSGISITFSLP